MIHSGKSTVFQSLENSSPVFPIVGKTPNTWSYGSTWLNARKDFQNDVRLDTSAGEVAEVRVALRDYTQGFVEIGLLPEYFPGRLYNDYEGQALYLNLQRSGANVECQAYRQFGTLVGGRNEIGPLVSCSYAEDQDVSIQVSTNWIRVYYDGVMIVNTNHGMTNYPLVYTHGLHPHIDFQSNNTTNGIVGLDYIKCRSRYAFGAPE